MRCFEDILPLTKGEKKRGVFSSSDAFDRNE